MVKSVQFYDYHYGSNPDCWNISPGAHDLSPDDDDPDPDWSLYREADAYFENWRPDQEWTAPKVHITFHDGQKSLVQADFLNPLPGGWVISQRAATRDLRTAINDGRVDPGKFEPDQLAAIRGGREKIPGLTWHHHQDRGRMQLVPEDAHSEVGHIGGASLLGGGSHES